MNPILLVVAAACAAAAGVWAKSARRLQRVSNRAEAEFGMYADATTVARSAFRKDIHTAVLYSVLAVSAGLGSIFTGDTTWLFMLVLIPVAVSIVFGRDFVRDSRIAEGRLRIERRAEEVLSQEDSAPRRWAERLAPEDLPELEGFEIAGLYTPGTGMMAGDFYDVFRLDPTRIAAIIGDVTGHGIDASITAFQTKYLLRMQLRQFRDPAQAIEELNRQMSAPDRGEEMVSLCVVVFDTEVGTLRYASAGHPPAWLWHDRDVRPLGATGPLLLLDPDLGFHSRELSLESGDLLVLYTDGLSEARSGDELFGEGRIGSVIRRDPGASPAKVVESLVESARDFARQPITDDMAILVVRRR